MEGVQKQVTIVAAREKRSVTGTPVVTLAGEVLSFQVIWKGKSKLSHPKLRPHWHSTIYHDHAVKKVQTSLSFGRLLTDIAKKLKALRVLLGLPHDYPALLIVGLAVA